MNAVQMSVMCVI